MVAQVNDTDLHKPWRKSFTDKQQTLVMKKTLGQGGGLHRCTDEENIALMVDVCWDKQLHEQARWGFKYTGTTVAFDKSEDGLISRDAKEFWDELQMRERIDEALKKL